MKKFKTIIFDLDGVIIDSKENMRLSWEHVRKNFELKQTFEMYFKHVGLPFLKILKKIRIKKNFNEITHIYKTHSIINFNKIKVIPGIIETLKKLIQNNVKIAIVTSKDIKRAKLIVKRFKIPIKVIVSPKRSLKGKPFPDQINLCLKKLKSKKENACYIGDMDVDYRTATNSKINFVFAQYGYEKKKKKYKNIIKKPENILKFI